MVYFSLCCIVLIYGSTFRAAPFYGKYDFLTIDSMPWWPEWQPMIEQLMVQGYSQPVLSDPVTSSILRGVFHQNTVYSRRDMRRWVKFIEELDRSNSGPYEVLPAGAVYLLLAKDKNQRNELIEQFTTYVKKKNEIEKMDSTSFHTKKPFRCMINLRGFKPTWVPIETGHWRLRAADTKWFYRMKKTHVVDTEKEIQSQLPDNCDVFY